MEGCPAGGNFPSRDLWTGDLAERRCPFVTSRALDQREKAKAHEAQLAADRDRDLQKRIAQKQAEIQRGFELARASATGVMPQ